MKILGGGEIWALGGYPSPHPPPPPPPPMKYESLKEDKIDNNVLKARDIAQALYTLTTTLPFYLNCHICEHFTPEIQKFFELFQGTDP